MAERTCLYCAAPVTGHRVQCGADPCRKAHNNAMQKRNSAAHKARTGISYTQKARPATMTPCGRCGKSLSRGVRTSNPLCRECRGPKLGPPKPRKRPVRAPARYRPDMRSPLRRAFEAKDADRFIQLLRDRSFIVQNGCWIWQGRCDKDGYATTQLGRRWYVHRATAELRWPHLGSLPIHHTCANRMCVNPDHQVPASHAENVGEMLGRQWYIGRIADLERALADVMPNHPVLGVIAVPANPFDWMNQPTEDAAPLGRHCRQPAAHQPSFFD